GGVDDDGVGAVVGGARNRVEGHAGRVGTFLLGHHRCDHPAAPGLQLLGGGGAEGVSGAQPDAPAVTDQDAGEFAGRGGLAGAVDTDDHDHGRTVTVRFGAYEAIGVGADLCEEFFTQQGTDLLRAPGTEYFHPGAQVLHDLCGGGDTDVCGDEEILDLFQGVLVQC